MIRTEGPQGPRLYGVTVVVVVLSVLVQGTLTPVLARRA
jgi:NhaP-type Na+/H+ or K+/H+ antiporter